MKTEKHTCLYHAGNIGNILIPFVIYFFAYLFAAVCLTALTEGAMQGLKGSVGNLTPEQEATVKGMINGIAMLLGTVPLFSTFKREVSGQIINGKSEEIRKGGKAENKRHMPCVFMLLTITLAITGSLSVNILLFLLHLPESSETYSQAADSQYGVLFPVGLLLYGIVSPLAEELVFRGIIYNRMKKYFSVLQAILFSALLFGIYHGNLVQGIYGFIIGILIACTYEKLGGFLYPILFHAAANVTVYVISGNQGLYDIFMTPVIGIVCAAVAMGALLFMCLLLPLSFPKFKNDCF